jgi:cell division protein FtsB
MSMKEKVDVGARIVEGVSAFVIAGVAFYGLVFTVIPLYSKAVLEEQKAQLELEVGGLQKRSAELDKQRQTLQQDRDAVSADKLRLEEDRSSLAAENARLVAERQKIEADNSKATRDSLALVNRLDGDRRRTQQDLQAMLAEKTRIDREFSEYGKENRRYVIDQLIGRILTRGNALYDATGFLARLFYVDASKVDASKVKTYRGFGTVDGFGAVDNPPPPIYGLSGQAFENSVKKVGGAGPVQGSEIVTSTLTESPLTLLREPDRTTFADQVRRYVLAHNSEFSDDLAYRWKDEFKDNKPARDAETSRHRAAHTKFKAAVDAMRAELLSTI